MAFDFACSANAHKRLHGENPEVVPRLGFSGAPFAVAGFLPLVRTVLLFEAAALPIYVRLIFSGVERWLEPTISEMFAFALRS